MRNEIELEAIIEDYLSGKLTAEEHKAFEQLRNNEPVVDQKVVLHKVFLESMQQYAEVLSLKAKMDNAHHTIDVESLSRKLKPHQFVIVRLWKKNKAALAVAASFVLLASVMMLSYYSQTKQQGSIQLLSGEINKIKHSQNSLIRKIDNSVRTNNLPQAKFGGSGFAISSNGYIITNYHVIKGADSVYIQNSKGQSFKVTSYYNDPVNDIAVLKISDNSFTNLGSLPYSLKKASAGLGEVVYTLGYPKDDIVLGDGYVSSNNGLNGDSLTYQVAIPVNPGNSGGPLLDNNGNVVGIINGKEEKTDGAAFAVKSRYIMEALTAIPQDSLTKRIAYGKRSQLQGLKRNKQIQKIQDYVFMIKVYN